MSISFYASKLEERDFGGITGKCVIPVYDMELLNRYMPEDDENGDPVPNPKYNPILDINQTAGRTAYMIENVLGMEMTDGEHFLEDIDIFLKHVNDPDIYDKYLENSYESRMIDRYRVLAYVGKLLGATHISAA